MPLGNFKLFCRVSLYFGLAILEVAFLEVAVLEIAVLEDSSFKG